MIAAKVEDLKVTVATKVIMPMTTCLPNLLDLMEDNSVRPIHMKCPRRGACVMTTLYQSANVVAYEDYCASEDQDVPSWAASVIATPRPSSHHHKRSIEETDDSCYEGIRDVKRRGSVDR